MKDTVCIRAMRKVYNLNINLFLLILSNSLVCLSEKETSMNKNPHFENMLTFFMHVFRKKSTFYLHQQILLGINNVLASPYM